MTNRNQNSDQQSQDSNQEEARLFISGSGFINESYWENGKHGDFLKLRIAGKENGETVFFKVTVSSHLVDLLEAEADAINSQDDAVFIAFKMKGLNPFAFEYPQDSDYAGELGVSIGSKLVGIHYMSINGDVIEDEVIEPHQDAASETSEQSRASRDSDARPRRANSKRGQGFNRNNRSGGSKRQSEITRKPARGQRFQQQPAY